MQSALYIVSTPIGNLKDITLRALEILKEVNFIACEDRRVTSFLLNHYEIKSDLVSVNARNENSKINYIIERINNGETCALVSDAGTPGISDPGTRLISAAIKESIQIIPIPGVSAALTALTISGLPTDSFVYEGFIPQKKGRQKLLKSFSGEKRTIIIYESTYRVEKLLKELTEYMPERLIVVCRELTKKFEEVWRGKPGEILADLPNKTSKGEFVFIISPLEWEVRD
ncbi:MAG TPA: 16S rRNA (cytidine(1402)-2'-O)-methyltransferase [Ignavibacteriaceae bacterium]|nr:16S rRNA (cytidine(1402)-2'-O)-methyltransferase [Ignavibacteriaceae bacterium]